MRSVASSALDPGEASHLCEKVLGKITIAQQDLPHDP